MNTSQTRERTTQYYACEHGIPGGCQFCNATKHQGVEAERDALKATNKELVEALRDLLDRVDRNGGLGEYKGGVPFATKTARELLAKAPK